MTSTTRTVREYRLDFGFWSGDLVTVTGAAAVVRSIVEGDREGYPVKSVTLVESVDELLERLSA